MEAERRQVTVLFADMVGFTAFSERSGEEAAFTLMQSLSKLMEDAVHDQGGSVQGFTGDGIMAVFGALVAFEDAPLRACKAAFAILQQLKSTSRDLEAKHGVEPQLRIGVNSGPAVVGKVQGGSGATITVLGDTVNVAARLQALAAPGSTVLSEVTHRLLQGLVETLLVGEHVIKGKSEPQRVYRLEAIREGTARFDAKIHRGLTTYVGRDRELEKLERALDVIDSGIQVFDISGEPGIGKSRLLHEFLTQVVKEGLRVLTGHCTADGQQPFRAFIEIVRRAFRLSPSDSEETVATKLDQGLEGLGHHSSANLGLMLNLLGLRAPQGALEGLDGLLIGLRTRDLVQQLIVARCRLRPMIILFEDLHWVDSASEDLLAKIVAIEEPLQLLILHTRRPEYSPPWADEARVTRLPLEPLSARETARIAEARIGVGNMPEGLAKLIAAKAEGNALFAEEIANFLVERGIVRRSAAGLDFNSAAVAAALPESVQSLLASRVDRLASADRNLLQAAAVIGRRFDPELVAAVGVSTSAQTAFAAMEALDLIHRVEGSTDYIFKHALVRDALYDGLLMAPRAALHLKVAEELERHGGNRLTEIAEILAHHYAATERADKAFAYLAMAGHKGLDIYSNAEAEHFYRQALAIFEKHANCAEKLSVAQVVVRLLEALTNQSDDRELGEVAGKYMTLVKEAGETRELVIFCYYRAVALMFALELRAGHRVMVEALAIAERLGDGRARAYARCWLLSMTSLLGLDSLEAAERMKSELLADSHRFGDNYVLNYTYFAVALDYFYRGLSKEARDVAARLIASGEERKDPRAIGMAHVLLGFTAMLGDEPTVAIADAEECMRLAVTHNDRRMAALIKASADVFLGRGREALKEIQAVNAALERSGSLFLIQRQPQGVALAMLGRISQGIRMIEEQIAKSDAIGDQSRAAWGRIILAEIYIQILSGKEKPTAAVVLKNFRTIAAAMIFGARRAQRLLQEAAGVKMLSERGILRARINFDLGVLFAMKKKRAEARTYFEKARIPAEGQGADKLLQRIDAAIAELD